MLDREITDQMYSEARLGGMSHRDALQFVRERVEQKEREAQIEYDRALLGIRNR